MSPDAEFQEEESPLVLGPINKQRWIYSCAKQMMDRIIFAYGEMEGLDYTLFRPFNWIGPKLDRINDPKEGSSRVLTYFLSQIFFHKQIKLVDGGQQRRSFTDIDDGIEALARIIENKDGQASRRIFNIGNPKNDFSIIELAQHLLDALRECGYGALADEVEILSVSSQNFFGTSYQDTQHRVPSIKNARQYLGWEPTVTLQDSLKKTLQYHLDPKRRANLPIS